MTRRHIWKWKISAKEDWTIGKVIWFSDCNSCLYLTNIFVNLLFYLIICKLIINQPLEYIVQWEFWWEIWSENHITLPNLIQRNRQFNIRIPVRILDEYKMYKFQKRRLILPIIQMYDLPHLYVVFFQIIRHIFSHAFSISTFLLFLQECFFIFEFLTFFSTTILISCSWH